MPRALPRPFGGPPALPYYTRSHSGKQLARLLGRLVKETGMVNIAFMPKMLFEDDSETALAETHETVEMAK